MNTAPIRIILEPYINNKKDRDIIIYFNHLPSNPYYNWNGPVRIYRIIITPSEYTNSSNYTKIYNLDGYYVMEEDFKPYSIQDKYVFYPDSLLNGKGIYNPKYHIDTMQKRTIITELYSSLPISLIDRILRFYNQDCFELENVLNPNFDNILKKSLYVDTEVVKLITGLYYYGATLRLERGINDIRHMTKIYRLYTPYGYEIELNQIKGLTWQCYRHISLSLYELYQIDTTLVNNGLIKPSSYEPYDIIKEILELPNSEYKIKLFEQFINIGLYSEV